MDERYLWWQQTLADVFFMPQSGPVALFVDDEELGKIARHLDDPAADLAQAVRDASSPVPGQYFSRVELARRNWKLGERATPPPILPVLALTVLSATRMRSDGQALSTNYYRRLAESLEPEADAPRVAELRDEVAGSAFLDVVTMWLTLDEWITEQGGRVGVSTIRNDERLTRIGYPQSQALLTRGDRAELTRLFVALDIRESGVPDELAMLRALEVWTAASQNRLSDTFMAALNSAETKGLIGAVVLAYAAAWDGHVVTKDGRRRIAVQLGIDLEDWTATWLFPAQDGAPERFLLDGLRSADAQVLLLENPPSRYYAVQSSPDVSGELLRHGFRLRGREYAAEFPKTEVVIFAADPDTGAWSSSAGITPFETHMIAAAVAESASVSRLLSRAADPGWVMKAQGHSPLLPGFTIYEGVRFSDGAALRSALSEEPGLRALGVAPTLVPRARFVRGLPLDGDLASNHYLLGGEPDLLLPTEEAPRLVVLSLGGKEEIVTANGFPFPLRRFSSPEGPTEVIADGQVLSFTLLPESVLDARPKGTASLGWNSEGAVGTVDESASVVGAFVAGSVIDAAVMCKRGRDETWLLSEGGTTRLCVEPEPPVFTHAAGFSFVPGFFEVPTDGSTRWLAQRSGPIWHLTCLTPESPRVVKASFDVLGTWARTAEAAGKMFWELQLGIADG